MRRSSKYYNHIQERLTYFNALEKRSNELKNQCQLTNLLTPQEQRALQYYYTPNTINYSQDEWINLVLDGVYELSRGRSCYCFNIKQAQAINYLSKFAKTKNTISIEFNEQSRHTLGIEYIKILHGDYDKFIKNIDIEYIKFSPEKGNNNEK